MGMKGSDTREYSGRSGNSIGERLYNDILKLSQLPGVSWRVGVGARQQLLISHSSGAWEMEGLGAKGFNVRGRSIFWLSGAHFCCVFACPKGQRYSLVASLT